MLVSICKAFSSPMFRLSTKRHLAFHFGLLQNTFSTFCEDFVCVKSMLIKQNSSCTFEFFFPRIKFRNDITIYKSKRVYILDQEPQFVCENRRIYKLQDSAERQLGIYPVQTEPHITLSQHQYPQQKTCYEHWFYIIG